ncbi:antibiotic biosynthesis monooxygenase [Chitinophaga flava]|nr:antibiotic biosynthesis monooxygenase [Chitinophaga flava]
MNTQETTLLVTFRIKPTERERFEAALIDDLLGARNEPGNWSMHLFQSKKDRDLLYFYERWQDNFVLDLHLQYDYTQTVFELAPDALFEPINIRRLTDLSPVDQATYRLPADTTKSIDHLITFTVPESEREMFINTWSTLVEKNRAIPGCVAFHLHSVENEPSTFVLYTRWENETAWRQYVSTPIAEGISDFLLELFPYCQKNQ